MRLGALVPFAQVPPLVAHFTGVRVDAETVRRLTEAAGAVADTLATDEVTRIERELPDPPTGPAVQLLSVDGAMVPLTGGTWSEVKTLAIGTVTSAARDDELVRTTDLSYFSRMTDATAFTRLATVETHRRGTDTARTVVAVVDGAAWCQGFIDHQRHDAVRILDFAHALEHLGAVAQAHCGAGTPAASEWLGTQAHALRHGREETVLTALADLASTGTPETQVVAQATQTYLGSRLEQIRYHAFAGRGYPIGSGCVESANKLVVEARLKGSGMHWCRANVNPMLALRTIVANGRWEDDWPRVWIAWRIQTRDRARQRRCHRQAALAPPTPPPAPPPDVDDLPESHHPHPARTKTIIDGKPTPNHPWRKASPFRAKS